MFLVFALLGVADKAAGPMSWVLSAARELVLKKALLFIGISFYWAVGVVINNVAGWALGCIQALSVGLKVKVFGVMYKALSLT